MTARAPAAVAGFGFARSAALGFAMLVAAAISGRAESLDPPSVTNLASGLLEAVVSITTTYKIDPRNAAAVPNLAPGEDLPEILGLGSGFVIDASGIIVTNNHVIEDAEAILAVFEDGSELAATVVGRDIATDIAVLRVYPPGPLATVVFGSSESVEIGQWVLAIGNPFGFGGTVTLGILSARGRDLNEGPYDNFLQTDAAINQGSSGGPLFDLGGNVIGVNTAIISNTGESIGIAFAIPSEIASRVVDQIVRFGEVRRGWLGVRIQEVTAGLAEGLGIEPRGALVAQVMEDSPAAAADFLAGDVVIRFDGQTIADMRDLPRIVAGTDVGRDVDVVVLRGGAEFAMGVTIAELEQTRPPPIVVELDDPPELPETISAAGLGLQLSRMTQGTRSKYGVLAAVEGVLITGVIPGSRAAERRVLEADIIVSVGNAPGNQGLATPADVDAALANELAAGRGVVVLLLARPDGVTRFEWIRLRD